MIEFIIQSGKHQGKRLSLPSEFVVVGREEDCQIRLTSDEVSRRHCELRTTEKGVVARDLGSRNGTFINELQIESETVLKAGDQLRVGPMILQLPDSAAAESTPGQGLAPAESAPARDDSTSDDDIASWLSDGDADEGKTGSGDTTIITAPKPPKKTPIPFVAPEPPKKVFKSIAEEAADIIRRHRESLPKDE